MNYEFRIMNYGKIILGLLFVVVLGFVGWMNVTPGHFRKICPCDRVRYVDIRNKLFAPCSGAEFTCGTRPNDYLLLLLASLDFYK